MKNVGRESQKDQMGKDAILAGGAFYEKLKIKKNSPAVWEDGMRTHGGKGTFEWWYVDAELEDGTTIVTGFYTKNLLDAAGPACPTVFFKITYPDGRIVERRMTEGNHAVIRASKEECNVTIGESYLQYVDGNYILKFVEGDVVFDVSMKSTAPMWRPETGHWYFGEKRENYFAWFVAQPSSDMEGTLKIGDHVLPIKGKAYHDHNWGNIPIHKVLNHWYWGRATLDDYTIIACDIVSEKKYGYRRLPVIFIAKGNKIITDDQSRTTIERSGTHQHSITGKFMDDRLTYMQPTDSGDIYKTEFIREKDLTSYSFVDVLPFMKKVLAKIVGANPTYVRTIGEVKLTITESNGMERVIQSKGLWEQLSLGKNKEAIINE